MAGKSGAPQYTSLADLGNAIAAIVNTYQSKVLEGVANGVDEAAEEFVKEVKSISPPNDGPGINGHYRDQWAVKKLSGAKYVRYVGNKKRVKAHAKDSTPTIPLINILEFSTTRGRPHVGKAVANSRDKIIDLIKSKL